MMMFFRRFLNANLKYAWKKKKKKVQVVFQWNFSMNTEKTRKFKEFGEWNWSTSVFGSCFFDVWIFNFDDRFNKKNQGKNFTFFFNFSNGKNGANVFSLVNELFPRDWSSKKSLNRKKKKMNKAWIRNNLSRKGIENDNKYITNN